jgi:hypothetical protein
MGILGDSMPIAPMPPLGSARENVAAVPDRSLAESESKPMHEDHILEAKSHGSEASPEPVDSPTPEVTSRRNRSNASQRSIESKFSDPYKEKKPDRRKVRTSEPDSSMDDDPEFRAAVRIDEDIRRAMRFRMMFHAGVTINDIINSALRVELASELDIVKSPDFAKIEATYK